MTFCPCVIALLKLHTLLYLICSCVGVGLSGSVPQLHIQNSFFLSLACSCFNGRSNRPTGWKIF